MRAVDIVILAAIAGLLTWGTATSVRAHRAAQAAADSRTAVGRAVALLEFESRAGRPVAALAALPGGAPSDGYGRALVLLPAADPRVPAGCFGLASLGSDGQPGGEGDAADCLAFGPTSWLAGTSSSATPRVALTRARIREVGMAVERFVSLTGKWPGSLDALMVVPDGVAGWPKEGLLPDAESLRDGWGRPFVYEPPAEAGSFWTLESLGADGARGGEGDDADLSNHASDAGGSGRAAGN